MYTRDLKIRGRGARTAMGVDEEDYVEPRRARQKQNT